MAENEIMGAVCFDDDEVKEGTDGKPHWYVVHTYSGHENKVKVNIEKMVENRNMQDRIFEIVVPTEDVVEVKDGQKKIITRKLFPGYVIVKMIQTDKAWYLVRNTQGVTGFVGDSKNPIELSDEEIARMGIEKVKIELDVSVGETVRIINGAFEGFEAVIEDINVDKQLLHAKLFVFGGDTPAELELEFTQVEKISK